MTIELKETYQSIDAGGMHTIYYGEDEDGRGYVQRWYGADPPADPPGQWLCLGYDSDGPDRTDPGYWLDNC